MGSIVGNLAFTPLLVQQIIVIVLGVGLFIGLISIFVRTRRQMRTEKAVATAQGETDVALRGIKSRLNYAGQLLNNERERAGYDRVRFSNGDADTLAALLLDAETRYTAVTQRFEAAVRALPKRPDEATYRALLALIAELTPKINPIEDALQKGIQHRTALEANLSQYTGRIDHARRAHATLAQRLNTLGVTVHTMLMPADKHLAFAQAALASHRYADIEPEIVAAMAVYDLLGLLLSQLVDIRNGIASGRQAAEKAALQGFDVQQSLQQFVEAARQIDGVLASLIAADIPAAQRQLAAAEALRAEAVARGGSLPVLQQKHGERIAALQQQNGQFTTLRQQAYAAFESLARSGLRADADIRQAGSEAQAHACIALVYTAHAQQLNTHAAHLHHDIATAVSSAERAQQRAQTIYACIIQRASDAAQMELVARAEYSDAEELIQRYVAMRDSLLTVTPATHNEIELTYHAAQHAADAMPFDGAACFHHARALAKLLTPLLRIPLPELAALISERSSRARTMLACQMNNVEQQVILFPLAATPDVERGIQSIRHEVNAFDASFHTASDLTNPLQSELSRLLQRYDRLNNALQHLQAQLLQAQQLFLQELDQTSGMVRTLLQRLLATADDESFRIAVARLHELDDQWQRRAVPRPKILLAVSDIIAHLPAAQSAAVRRWDPPPYLAIRAWGRQVDGITSDLPELPPLKNADPRW